MLCKEGREHIRSRGTQARQEKEVKKYWGQPGELKTGEKRRKKEEKTGCERSTGGSYIGKRSIYLPRGGRGESKGATGEGNPKIGCWERKGTRRGKRSKKNHKAKRQPLREKG